MAESSGSLKPSNGSSHANGKMNGQTTGRKRPMQKRRSFIVWTFNAIARLATWAVILTIFFRCPPSLEACDETSPFICEHYFRAKNLVSPYAQPYYDQFVVRYVDFAKPYYEAVDGLVLTPARRYAVQHGAPWVQKGQEHAWSQWEKHGQPQVAQIRLLSQKHYDETIVPYLARASEVAGPYYEIGRTNTLQLFYDFLVPTYEYVQPYARQGYSAASSFTTEIALPAAHWTWDKTNAFLDKAVWPQMRVVYVENVEPQLLRIGERLGRYKNRTKAKVLSPASSTSVRKPAPESPQSSFSKPAPQSTLSPASSASEQTTSIDSSKPEKPTETYWNPVRAPPPTKDETEQRKIAREMVAHDLEMWQNKFAAQADEGAVDMEDRIDDIARRMIDEEATTTGKSLIEKLQSTVQSEVDGLKLKVSTTIADSSDSSAEDIEDRVISAIRSAGIAIKGAAQAIRSWREDYDEVLQEAVLSAAGVHFQILDETRGLALQQIGMKWAWTDGVTYKDWATYHELKRTLSEWTEELKQIIVTHPTLLAAQDASAQVEDNGMSIASAAAKELARLKQVAHWKVSAKDATDNFESEAMRLAAEAAQKATEAQATLTDDVDSNTAAEEAMETAEATAEVVHEGDPPVATLIVADEDIVETLVPSSDASQAASSVGNAADGVSTIAEEQFEAESQTLSSTGPEEASEKPSAGGESATSTLSGSLETSTSDTPSLAAAAQGTLGGEEAAGNPTADSVSKVDVTEATSPGSDDDEVTSTTVAEASETSPDVFSSTTAKSALTHQDDSESTGSNQDIQQQPDDASVTIIPSAQTAFLGGAAQHN